VTVVVVSNRGPLTFQATANGDGLVAKRGAGGLVSGLAPAVAGSDAVWVAAAMTDGDRQAAAAGIVAAEDMRVRLLELDPAAYRMAYDVVGNATLWFLHHGLFDLARRPRFDERFREAWDAYREVNRSFAEATAEAAPDGAVVLVQDYHLALVGPFLAERRPDIAAVHFTHTPFCGPDALRVLPRDCAVELLTAMSSYRACGFHTERWATAFRAGCAELLGTQPVTFVSPLAADPEDIGRVAASAACVEAGARFDADVGDRRVILRVDRLELSKNLLRGFHAYDDLLARYPEHRERVVFAALLYASREGLPEYLAYRQEVEGLVAQVNERWATPGWTPIVFDLSDDFPRSVAALQRFDVLLVNPIRDGLNLVAKEGMLVNRRGGVLALSTEAGAWDELGDRGALPVNPFDVTGTADVLAEALAMPAAERAERASSLRSAAAARHPSDWLADQVAAAAQSS
jgi:trehalose 6-phosphate synthase